VAATSSGRRVLAIDVGAGTQDILLYDSTQTIENSYKLVMPSRTVIVGRQIERATAEKHTVVLSGNLMGGGSSARALGRHLSAGLKAYATPEAARTFHDNLDKVRAMGLIVTDQLPDNPAEGITRVWLGDIDVAAIQSALAEFDVSLPTEFAIAVQDHGNAPFQSNRIFRFEHWKRFIEAGGQLQQLAYRDPPEYLTRMKSVQREVSGALLMDTGVAAMWGALGDEEAARAASDGIVVVNVGNGHIIGALVQQERVWGLFEHHTGAIGTSRLVEYIEQLMSRTIKNDKILAEGGHGAFVHPDFPGWSIEHLVVVTGPNRYLLNGKGYRMAVPFGGMMLSGCFGLLAGCGIDLTTLGNQPSI
jgi:uncharacterized protein (DUF1786 family)